MNLDEDMRHPWRMNVYPQPLNIPVGKSFPHHP
jgi:hypothetical protein